MIILAGVTINLVVGQNGLIAKAKEAREKTLQSEITESDDFKSVVDYINENLGNAETITKDDYGKVVTNYTAGDKTWEIFYADNKNVYLITRESIGYQKLTIDGYNGTDDSNGNTNDFANASIVESKYPAVAKGWLYGVYDKESKKVKYKSSYDNMKATEYLLDSEVWNKIYKLGNKVDWAIGGPTLEMFVASYSKYEGKTIRVTDPAGNGYDQVISSGLIQSKANGIYNNMYSYWIACPGSYNNDEVRIVSYGYEGLSSNKYNESMDIRPVICLNSSVTLMPSADGTSYTMN